MPHFPKAASWKWGDFIMWTQVFVGISVIIATAFIHAYTISFGLTRFNWLTKWAAASDTLWRSTVALAATVVWVMMAHILELLLWGVVFTLIHAFKDMETAFYFSLVSYTTLGLGDILPGKDWNILTGMTAANGFLVFGWSTAFQVSYLDNLQRMRRANKQLRSDGILGLG